MLLKDIAYARSGDKGDVVNIGVLAYNEAAYQRLLQTLTPERIKRHFGDWVRGGVEVYPMPNINAIQILLRQALGGGATRTLRYDVTGKAFSTALLRMEVADVD